MRKRCKCLPADRKASFMMLNGQNIYMCTKCGRYHDTRTLPRYWDTMWIGICALGLLLLSVGLWMVGR